MLSQNDVCLYNEAVGSPTRQGNFFSPKAVKLNTRGQNNQTYSGPAPSTSAGDC